MNTTTAAAQAGVTVATVRAWCRYGAVAAVKRAGRWIIDAASLAYRIGLTGKTCRVVYSIETMTAIGGSRWTKAGRDRVYLNDWARFIGLDVSHYNSGNISYAALDGEEISNSEARRLLDAVNKVYFDTADGRVHINWGFGNPRRFDREDLAEAIFSGIRAAIAAL